MVGQRDICVFDFSIRTKLPIKIIIYIIDIYINNIYNN